MSYSVTTLDGERKPRRLPGRELDPIEVRVLGCLMEKQLATPEYYPLTINALVAACNQKSNREPVMEVGESEVQRSLDGVSDAHTSEVDRSAIGTACGEHGLLVALRQS